MADQPNILIRVLRSWVCIGVCFVAVIVQCAAGEAIHKWVVGSLGIKAGIDFTRFLCTEHVRVILDDQEQIIGPSPIDTESARTKTLYLVIYSRTGYDKVEPIRSCSYRAQAYFLEDGPDSMRDITKEPFLQEVLKSNFRQNDGTLLMNDAELQRLYAGAFVEVREFYWPALVDGLLDLALLAAFIAGCVLRFRWHEEKRRLSEYQCPKCSYDLRGIAADTCPECGVELEWPDEGHRRAVERGGV